MVMEQISGMDLGCTICSKLDTGQAIEAIITQLEKQAGVTVCLIRCNGAPEFIAMNSTMQKFLSQKGIVTQTSSPHMSEENRIME